MTNTAIRPGQIWLDTNGNRIQAHGGSIFYQDVFTWYGENYTDVSGEYSSHFPHSGPPFTREAPAHFERDGIHYLITSGTTGYCPNFSEVASGPGYHGPFTDLGDAHPGDQSRTSHRSQISCIFKHPDKQDLYIAMADRWLPQLPDDIPNVHDVVAAIARGDAPPDGGGDRAAMAAGLGENTAIADYVWLPIRFDGTRPRRSPWAGKP